MHRVDNNRRHGLTSDPMRHKSGRYNRGPSKSNAAFLAAAIFGGAFTPAQRQPEIFTEEGRYFRNPLRDDSSECFPGLFEPYSDISMDVTANQFVAKATEICPRRKRLTREEIFKRAADIRTAVFNGDLLKLKLLLLGPGSDPSSEWRIALKMAIAMGNENIINFLLFDEQLIPHRLSNKEKDASGKVMLEYAINIATEHGHQKIVPLLLKCPEIRHIDHAIKTAAFHGHEDLLKLLLADKRISDVVHSKSANVFSEAFSEAVRGNQKSIVRFFHKSSYMEYVGKDTVRGVIDVEYPRLRATHQLKSDATHGYVLISSEKRLPVDYELHSYLRGISHELNEVALREEARLLQTQAIIGITGVALLCLYMRNRHRRK